MRLLLVTADDLGADPQTNAAIARAAQDGVVTQASLLVTGEAVEAGCAALGNRVPIGVHLDLTRGPALTGRVPGLTDAAGRFRGLGPLAVRALTGTLDRQAVTAELLAQLSRARDLGLAISHVDGHHHAHLLPGVAPIVISLCQRMGVRALRLPAGAPCSGECGARGKRLLLALAALGVRAPMGVAGLLTADHFRGTGLWQRRDHAARLARLLDGLSEGTTELMVHPRDGELGRIELASLCDPLLRARLLRRGVRLGTWADVPG